MKDIWGYLYIFKYIRYMWRYSDICNDHYIYVRITSFHKKVSHVKIHKKTHLYESFFLTLSTFFINFYNLQLQCGFVLQFTFCLGFTPTELDFVFTTYNVINVVKFSRFEGSTTAFLLNSKTLAEENLKGFNS